MTRRTLTVSIATLLLTAGIAHAAFTTPVCLAKKRTAWTNLRKCQGTEEAKQLLGKPTDLMKCQTKFDAKLAAAGDKATAAAVPCRYADHGDGTVIDYDTGLQWEKKTPGACSNALVICLTDDDCPGGSCGGRAHYVNATYTWDGAHLFVDGTHDILAPAGAFVAFAGHSDWRLPTVDELRGIIDPKAAGCGSLSAPCIDPIFGPTFSSNWDYWAAPLYVDGVGGMVVGFAFSAGIADPVFKSHLARARAVRSAL